MKKVSRLSPMIEQSTPHTPSQWAANIGLILAATAAYSLGLIVFSAPNHIAPSGITGIATIVNYLTQDMMPGGIPIGVLNLVLNIPIAILGFVKLGRHFMIKTLIFLAGLPFFSDFVFAKIPVYTGNRLVAAIFAGVIMGGAVGLVFSRGGSTAGFDIVNKIIQLRLPHIQLGKIIFASNLLVVVFSMIAYGDIEPGLFALISLYISSVALDKVLYGFNICKFLYIVTDKAQELGRRINVEMYRGATILESYGSYTNKRRPTIMVAVRQNEYYRVKRIINQVDPMAFIIVTSATEVTGKGFTEGMPRS